MISFDLKSDLFLLILFSIRHFTGIFSSISEQRTSIDKIFAEKGLESSYYTA